MSESLAPNSFAKCVRCGGYYPSTSQHICGKLESVVDQLAEQLAAARREVETVTRERDEANQKLANLIPMPTERMPADREWAHSEWACNQWYLANEAAMHYKAERDTAQQDLATSRAALEDVRKWPARVREKFGITAETQNVCTHGVGYQDTEKRHYWNGYADAVDDAERALAQEAGDGTP